MLNTLALYTMEGSTVVSDFDLSKIADALGMNLNSESNILYMGDDPTTGFLFDTSSNMTIFLCNKGEYVGSYMANAYAGAVNYLYYKVSENGVAFSIGESENITCCCSLATNPEDGTDHYIYIGGYESTYSYKLVTDLGTYETFQALIPMSVPNVVTMAPLVCPTSRLIAKSVFMPISFLVTNSYVEFTMNGKDYISGNAYNTTSGRFVLEL